MLKIDNLKINKKEVLRYLGYKKQKIDDNMLSLIDETIEESTKIIIPRYVYATYDILTKEDGILLQGTNLLLQGNDIKAHLNYSKRAVIMATTIGPDIERKIAYYERVNLTKAFIMDSCATTAVEEVCDIVEKFIKEEKNKEGSAINYRYSPGYGDLPLNIQRDFINTLQADKIIGVNVSAQNMLMPRKSVTAIIGIIEQNIEIKRKTCETCPNYKTCNYRKEGKKCGD